jgi:hypothetical protein
MCDTCRQRLIPHEEFPIEQEGRHEEAAIDVRQENPIVAQEEIHPVFGHCYICPKEPGKQTKTSRKWCPGCYPPKAFCVRHANKNDPNFCEKH